MNILMSLCEGGGFFHSFTYFLLYKWLQREKLESELYKSIRWDVNSTPESLQADGEYGVLIGKCKKESESEYIKCLQRMISEENQKRQKIKDERKKPRQSPSYQSSYSSPLY